ncbi:hypothetical protein IE81DRAFT_196454 [Ceraceosorus guamensis]|uniref:Uncharacterized protein n=1 Tax=Ceraceosorus guamensis TaxID=1522189 RepID=A0A316VXB3_9BASI|nr:hypothetical protein IE81DRAFT_196454 [Ceraceosorus guamensis]PWN41073.1 hypothetical protein IE81DRAFT_196454 [Ceraceosorus guamensis]
MSHQRTASQSSAVSVGSTTSSGSLGTSIPALHSQIRQLRTELETLRAAHDALLARSVSEEGTNGPLNAAQARISALETQVETERSLREDEEAKVQDLRLRAEESRRAIMRLQGEAAGTKKDNRRSVGPSSLANWVPPSSAGYDRDSFNVAPTSGAAGTGGANGNTGSSTVDEEEMLARRRSKRASLAFGASAAGRSGFGPASSSLIGIGHRRTASGGTEDSVGGGAGGLRELRLGGTGGNAALAPESAATGGGNSRRSSAHSMLSPAGSHAELAGTSPSDGLTVPIRPSPSPSPSNMTSPILEDEAEHSILLAEESPGGADMEGDGPTPTTARAPGAGPPSATGGLGTGTGVRALAEAQGKLRARESELDHARKEVRKLKELLQESTEARDASELCLKALRQFIADGAAAGGSGAPNSDPGISPTDTAIKLPPLPTDKDIGDEEGTSPSKRQAAAASTWGARFGSAFARTKSDTPAALPSVPPTPTGPDAYTKMPDTPGRTISASSANGLRSPPAAASGGLSLAGMFSRGGSTAANGPLSPGVSDAGSNKNRESVTSIVSDASTGTGAASTAATEPEASLTAPPPAVTRGLSSWFSKRASTATPPTSNSASADLASSKASENGAASLASPPFASLDHSQLHRVTSSNASSPPNSAGAAGNALLLASGLPASPQPNESAAQQQGATLGVKPPHVELSERAKRTASRTSFVAEDDGFVGPSFT